MMPTFGVDYKRDDYHGSRYGGKVKVNNSLKDISKKFLKFM